MNASSIKWLVALFRISLVDSSSLVLLAHTEAVTKTTIHTSVTGRALQRHSGSPRTLFAILSNCRRNPKKRPALHHALCPASWSPAKGNIARFASSHRVCCYRFVLRSYCLYWALPVPKYKSCSTRLYGRGREFFVLT